MMVRYTHRGKRTRYARVRYKQHQHDIIHLLAASRTDSIPVLPVDDKLYFVTINRHKIYYANKTVHETYPPLGRVLCIPINANKTRKTHKKTNKTI